jgi:hypothetical protein
MNNREMTFQLNQNHPIIPRQQNFELDRKIISFHSEDRDISMFPYSNLFDITLPETLLNIQSMRLVNISLPNNQYVFSTEYQNTKFNFSADISGQTNSYDVTIDEGTYTPNQLELEIENKMNRAVIEYQGYSPAFSDISGYANFKCKYNEVSNTFWFGNDGSWDISGSATTPRTGYGKFSLNFNKKMSYNISCNQIVVWDHYNNWGFPSYLGYEKKKYIAQATPRNPYFNTADNSGNPFGFSYEIFDPTDPINGGYWLTSYSADLSGNQNWYVDISSSKCNLNIMGEEWIYMEVEKYNTIDELEPYSKKTNHLFNNDYAAKVNSAFAKIPQHGHFSYNFDSNKAFISNYSYYTPPIIRLKKLRFKFRYHDGRLVNFKCLPLSFMIEFNMLKDRQAKNMTVNVPPAFFNS